MKTFLGEVARYMWDRYGPELSDWGVLIPNRRTGLFLSEELSLVADRPLWQPRYRTTLELASDIGGLQAADRIRAVTELYSIWCPEREEPLDRFWYWGETLLSDFDTVDKYLVDADALFSNVHSLKSMDADFSYLTPAQREAAARFWGDVPDGSTGLRRDFARVWSRIAPAYHGLVERLSQLGVGYEGMIFRRAAQAVRAGGGPARPRRYAVVGFNALNEAEKALFDWLASEREAEFFWDYDPYYIDDRNQEAGLFLRADLNRWPPPPEFPTPQSRFAGPKNITVVQAPSDSMQVKYAAEFLEDAARRSGRAPGRETAIVLTDESLLVPLLHSLPPEASQVNITMGYPLRGTLAYGLAERLLRLQLHCRGDATFSCSDVLGLLGHPCLLAVEGELCRETARTIRARSLIRVPQSLFPEGSLCADIFRPCPAWSEMLQWLVDALSRADRALYGAEMSRAAARRPDDSEPAESYAMREQHEFFAALAQAVRRFSNSLQACGVNPDIPVCSMLLRRALSREKIPYGGRPLEGVQIMGMLETRCLDFENVLVLSLDDDNFPGRVSQPSSFIPNNIRAGYGMPTPRQSEAIYACYFYRLLQRAADIHLSYCNKTDENSSGEPCRYILQLEAERGHPMASRKIGLDVNLPRVDPPDELMPAAGPGRLSRYLSGGDSYLSPTALNAWIDCPLKFRMSYVLRLRPEEELSPEIDSPLFGTILHKAMELLYRPLVGVPDPRGRIKALKGSDAVEEAVREAVSREYFGGRPTSPDRYEGSVLLVYKVVCRYIDRCVLPFDAARDRFTVVALERPLRGTVGFRCGGRELQACLGGTADRVELLSDGVLSIVDYKTGAPPSRPTDLPALFDSADDRRNPAVFQTLLYSLLAARMQEAGELPGSGVEPALYYVRRMNQTGYSPAASVQGYAPGGFASLLSELETGLGELLSRIFDPGVPLRPCADLKRCRNCDYSPVCGRDI